MAFLKKGFIPIVFLLILTIVLFYPLLFGGQIAADEESIGGYYPNAFFYQQSIKKGESLLWNDSYYGGFPNYLNLFVGQLYPLHYLLFKFLPFLTAYHLAIFIPAFLGAVLAYFFARKQSVSKVGSLVTAMGYLTAETFGGFNTGLSYANGFMILPWLAFSVLGLQAAGNFWQVVGYVVFGGVGVTIGFLAGFPQVVLYSLTFVFVYALFLDPYRWKAAWGFVAMVAIGAVAAAPQLIPTFLFLDDTIRTVGYTAAVSDNLSFGVLLNFLFPYHLKLPRVSEGGAGLYIGVLPLILALVAVLFFRNKKINFFFAAYTFIFLMGLHVPLVSLINDHLPLFSRISGVARWFLIGSFILSLLAGYGYDRLVANRDVLRLNKNFRFLVWIFGVVAALIIAGAVAGNLILWQITENDNWRQAVFDFLIKNKSLRLPLEHYQGVFNQMIDWARHSFSFLNWRFALPVFLFPLNFGLLRLFLKNVNQKVLSLGVLAITTINVIVVFYSSFAEELTSQKIFEEEPVVARAIKQRENDLNSFRYFSLLGDEIFKKVSVREGLSADERAVINKELLTNQFGAFYGLKTIAGFEPLRTLKQSQLIDTISPQNFLQQLDLLSLMGVKYIISLYPLSESRLSPIVLDSVEGLPIPVYLYENTGFVPLIHFAGNDDSEIVSIDYHNGGVEVFGEIKTGGWLVFSQTGAPGWVASIDGLETPIYTANYLFQAVYVPGGRHQIKFIYEGYL